MIHIIENRRTIKIIQ